MENLLNKTITTKNNVPDIQITITWWPLRRRSFIDAAAVAFASIAIFACRKIRTKNHDGHVMPK